jgi:hypothetical protein
VIWRSPDPSPLTIHISRRGNPELFQRNASCWLSDDQEGEDGDVPVIEGFDRIRSIVSADALLSKTFLSSDFCEHPAIRNNTINNIFFII